MTSNPFLRPDDCRYEEILTDAAVHVLATTGVDRFSVAAMARWMKVTPLATRCRRRLALSVGSGRDAPSRTSDLNPPNEPAA